MRKSLGKIVLFVLVSPFLALAFWIGRYFLFPVSDVPVPVPFPSVNVSLQVWASFETDGSHYLTIRNPYGKLTLHLWEDWGPAQRSNYYRTPEGWLAVLGSGDLVALVEVRDGTAPHSIRPAGSAERTSDRSAEWQYLGAINGNGYSYRFYPPLPGSECVDRFGSQDMRYRQLYQKKFC